MKNAAAANTPAELYAVAQADLSAAKAAREAAWTTRNAAIKAAWDTYGPYASDGIWDNVSARPFDAADDAANIAADVTAWFSSWKFSDAARTAALKSASVAILMTGDDAVFKVEDAAREAFEAAGAAKSWAQRASRCLADGPYEGNYYRALNSVYEAKDASERALAAARRIVKAIIDFPDTDHRETTTAVFKTALRAAKTADAVAAEDARTILRFAENVVQKKVAEAAKAAKKADSILAAMAAKKAAKKADSMIGA